MLNKNVETASVVNANADAFLAMMKIAFASIEQLTVLNLNATRSSFEQSAAAAGMMIDSKGAMQSSETNKASQLVQRENAATYFQGVQQIASEAQDELTKLMNAYLVSQGAGVSNPFGWLQGFDAFKGFGQEFANFAESNRKVMTDASSQVMKKANTLPKKPA